LFFKSAGYYRKVTISLSNAFSNADVSYLFPSLYMKGNALYNYFIANELDFLKTGGVMNDKTF